MDFNANKGLQAWHEQHPHESKNLLSKIWEASNSYKEGYHPDVDKGLDAFKRRMNQHQPAKIARLSPVKIVLRIAAGIALLFFSGMFLKNKLSDNNLVVEMTKDGATKELTLKDGSLVTLNESSQLTFQKEFSKNERKVTLEGEAFFKITRDVSRPFIIEAGMAKVTVLGTSFNVRSFPKQNVFEVYVQTGKVKVDFEKGNGSYLLTPGEYLRFDDATGKPSKVVDKSGAANAWRTGVISFKGQSIPDIFAGMERLYGVSFKFQQESQNSDCLQTLTVQKGKMGEAIEALKTSCPKLKFKGDQLGYIVTGTCCE
ncbi:MAG: DUF4974 domain-containing protein [Bacteroidetes bacterium]|nr:DUF4974 domain-containing protein [Bacteroidota bacterium]